MKVESFFADRIHDALAAAHRQLGPEAVLLASHRASAESRHLGAFEVVCGCRETPEAPPAANPRARVQAAAPPAREHQRNRDTGFLQELLAATPGNPGNSGGSVRVEAAPTGPDSTLISWPQVELGLMAEGFPAWLAAELIRGLKTELRGRVRRPVAGETSNRRAVRRNSGASMSQFCLHLRSLLPLLDDYADADARGPAPAPRPWLPPDSDDDSGLVSVDDLERTLRATLRSRLRQPAIDLRQAEGVRALALVGPCGSGKTLLAIKIAVDASIRRGRSVRFVAIPSSTPGSTRRMESMSALVGCSFSLLEHPRDLPAACQSRSEDELLIVDTPGFSTSQEGERRLWASALAQEGLCEVALVMPATMKATDLLAASRQYEPFQPTMLAFAHVDQTESLCACLALAVAAGLPVGYLSGGQEIPEDLETPTAAEFLGRSAPVFQRELARVS